MKTAFCLFKYFPYGGLQRDFLNIALQRVAAGDEVFVYTLGWQGNKPKGLTIKIIKNRALTNHSKYKKYFEQVSQYIRQDNIDCVVGFNKMPGLDIYFAADPCYKAHHHGRIQQMSPRYKHFIEFERAVFVVDSHTHILVLADRQQAEYQHSWHTPDERFTLMPPGIHRSACAAKDSAEQRQRIRDEFVIDDDQILLLMIGSGFKTKGLDRALIAIHALPKPLREKVQMRIIGQDKAAPFARMIKRLSLQTQVKILPGRNDINAIMQAGDLLIHPAGQEVAGKVILEAIVTGLPVIVTDVCGYAHHVNEAQAGIVLESPFNQNEFNKQLALMLETDRQQWRENGIHYGRTRNLYGMAEAASSVIRQSCCNGADR